MAQSLLQAEHSTNASEGWSTTEAAVELLLGKIGEVKASLSGLTPTVHPRQYEGVPSTFTIGTADGTVFTLAANEIGFIQNLDDAALAVKKGASASTTSLSFVLAAGVAATDGTGGAVLIDDWVGVVSVAAMTGTARYIAWKQALS